MKSIGYFFFSLLLTVSLLGFSQKRESNKILLSGTIYGYNFDSGKKILKKDKEISLEGSIGGVTITVLRGKNKISSIVSNSNGEFRIYVPLENDLKFKFSKKDYTTSLFLINLADVPNDLAKNGLIFLNMELILNSYIDKSPELFPFGELYYRKQSKNLAFNTEGYEQKKKLFNKREDNTPVNLMNGAIKKNVNNNKKVNESHISEDENSNIDLVTGLEIIEAENDSRISSKFILSSDFKMDDLDNMNFEERAQEIKYAWAQLDKDKLLAVTPEDYMILKARENLLIAAEKELDDAKNFIQLQKDQISSQRNAMILMSVLFLILILFALNLWRNSKIKGKLNNELRAKSKKINSSINYALRIQNSILLSDEEIKNILPNSFIYYQPLDIVSGDFYWFSKIDNKIIIAAVDCTGHGVPGAFMSFIGNTLLNEIINEKKIIDPAKVLNHLHEGIVKSLRQTDSEKNNQDGMDMSLVLIDQSNKTLEFAGAMNPLYVVNGDKVEQLGANIRGVGGVSKRMKTEIDFEKVSYKYSPGTCIYLTSDGYMDQFGGPDLVKFNIPRFNDLLLNMNKGNFESQKESVEKALMDWKGSSKQIDDILVIGVKL